MFTHSAAARVTCNNFTTIEQAQAHCATIPDNPSCGGMDRDRDGVPCEHLVPKDPGPGCVARFTSYRDTVEWCYRDATGKPLVSFSAYQNSIEHCFEVLGVNDEHEDDWCRFARLIDLHPNANEWPSDPENWRAALIKQHPEMSNLTVGDFSWYFEFIARNPDVDADLIAQHPECANLPTCGCGANGRSGSYDRDWDAMPCECFVDGPSANDRSCASFRKKLQARQEHNQTQSAADAPVSD